jgi:hypothetical protein
VSSRKDNFVIEFTIHDLTPLPFARRAVRAATRARELAAAQGEADLIPAIEARLHLYESGQPFHTPP